MRVCGARVRGACACVCVCAEPLLVSRSSALRRADPSVVHAARPTFVRAGMSGTMYKREDLAGMMDKLGDMMPEGMEGMEGMGGDDSPDVDDSGETEEPKEEL